MIDRFAKRICILSFVFCPSLLIAGDSIYNATQIKLDIASPIIIPAANKWKMQHYEMAVNVQLKHRFYPTLELGYSGGQTTQGDSITYNGQGGFFRVGCDINPLKKRPDSPHALLVGVRLGTAVQDFAQNLQRNDASTVNSPITSDANTIIHTAGAQADCWGEIVIGCQVNIAKGFYMGWMGRLKALFTRNVKAKTLGEGDMQTEVYPQKAIYIPGYGKRDNIGWGVNYYLGWRF